MLKLEFFLDEMDFVMNNEFDIMINEEDLIMHFKSMFFDIHKNYEKFMYNYLIKVKDAHITVLEQMIEDITFREAALIDIDVKSEDLNDIKKALLDLKFVELYKKELEELPIFD
jgi:hypothetical protein